MEESVEEEVSTEQVSVEEDQGILKSLYAASAQQLEALPAPSRDPLLTAFDHEEEHNRARQVKAQSRMAAIDKRIAESECDETMWREQIQQRKEAERRRIAEEAAERAALLAKAQEEERLAAANTPLAVARRTWAADDCARQEARIQVATAYKEAAQLWLDDEWKPRLQSHREQLRADRAAAERRVQEEREAREQALQREIDAMTREDAASSSFRGYVTAECAKRSSTNHEGVVKQPDVQSVLASKLAQMQRDRELEMQRLQAEETARREETARQEREYRDWKREVRSTRCRQKLAEQQEGATSELGREQYMGLCGREYLRENLQHQSVLEDALLRATVDVHRMRANGACPRGTLEDALRSAASEKKTRDQLEPAKVEQELWESMLAKNRLARQQERSSKTPRWGIFVS